MTDMASNFYAKPEKPENFSRQFPNRCSTSTWPQWLPRQSLEFLGTEPELFPLESIQHVSAIPPMLIIHGIEDSVVPVEHSRFFVNQVKKLLPETKIELVTVSGAEDGFDKEFGLTEIPWLKDGLDMITSETRNGSEVAVEWKGTVMRMEFV
ncbi:hypothetical protein C8J56DRAFT_863353 [Mycena floridula]|nr:hypothetical protein C8J56DRAFT_863353 [Mycena floridula]